MSSISTASYGPLFPAPDTGYGSIQQTKAAVGQLATSLSSGDITSAQKAFANLQQSLGLPPSTTGATSTTTPPTPTNTLASDYAAIGQALQSGDLSGAQKAFASLEQDAKTASNAKSGHRAHRHHHENANASANPTLTASSDTQSATDVTSSSGSTNSINLVV